MFIIPDGGERTNIGSYFPLDRLAEWGNQCQIALSRNEIRHDELALSLQGKDSYHLTPIVQDLLKDSPYMLRKLAEIQERVIKGKEISLEFQ